MARAQSAESVQWVNGWRIVQIGGRGGGKRGERVVRCPGPGPPYFIT